MSGMVVSTPRAFSQWSQLDSFWYFTNEEAAREQFNCSGFLKGHGEAGT